MVRRVRVRRARRVLVLLATVLSVTSCGLVAPRPSMNQIAERYVKLVLQVGQHDENFVDAYYGNPSWKPAGPATPLGTLAAAAAALRQDLVRVKPSGTQEELVRLRYEYLDKQIAAVEAKLAMLQGE